MRLLYKITTWILQNHASYEGQRKTEKLFQTEETGGREPSAVGDPALDSGPGMDIPGTTGEVCTVFVVCLVLYQR